LLDKFSRRRRRRRDNERPGPRGTQLTVVRRAVKTHRDVWDTPKSTTAAPSAHLATTVQNIFFLFIDL